MLELLELHSALTLAQVCQWLELCTVAKNPVIINYAAYTAQWWISIFYNLLISAAVIVKMQ